jgi:hypothetical protein
LPDTTAPPGPPLDSAAAAAKAREQAIVDSLRRRALARSESVLQARRLAGERQPRPQTSPTSGSPPFFGYTWVFYADIALGALLGYLALRIRHRRLGRETQQTWSVVSAMLGGLGGAAVFLPFFLLNIFFIFFNPMPPWLMFALSAGVIVFASLGLALDRRSAPRRRF